MIRLRLSALCSGAIAGVLLPASVNAQQYPSAFLPCAGLPGCGAGPTDIISMYTIPTIVALLLQLVAAGALSFIVYSGVMMLTANGDDGQINKARKGIEFAFMGLGLAIVSGTLVSLVASQDWIAGSDTQDILFGASGFIATVLFIVVRLFNVAFAIVVVIAGMKMVLARGNSGEFGKATGMVVWAIVGAIVVNLARVVVQAFLNLNLDAG